MKRKKALFLFIILAVSICVFYPTHASPDTFGKTDVGGSQASEWNWGSKLGCRFQCPEDGIVTEIDWYGHVYPGYGSRTIYAAIYSDNNGVPDALLGYVSTTVSETWQWWSFTGLSVPVSANSYYWLVINWDQFNIEYRYDVGATRQYAYQDDQRDRPPPSDPFGESSFRNRAMSIYAVYTPSGPDTRAPTYSNVGTNTTVAGSPCLFQARWNDDFGLSGFIFGTNNSGTWQNDTWTPWIGTPTSGWSNVVKTLNNTPGGRIAYRFWCNDTSNNWGDTGVQYIVTTQKPVRAVIIYSDFNYYYTMGGTSYIFSGDAVVFGILQAAGIPYDIKPANEMAHTNKLKDYSLIVFPEYFAYRLPENLTSAVIAACNEGVGVWTVGFTGEENENGLLVSPKFISQVNNVVPFGEETSVLPQIVVNDTYLIGEYYSSGEILGVGSILGPQPFTQFGVYDPSRPYHEIVSVFREGGTYLGAGIVASTLGRGRTVWCGSGESLWKAQGILVRLVRWATKSPVFLELADSPATGVSLQLRVDGCGGWDEEQVQAYRDFMQKIGNITDARVSLYIVTDVFNEERYSIARDYSKNEYGSHSRHHGWLPTLSPEGLADEMNGSKTIIETNLGWNITGFAYPYNSYSKTTTAGAGAYDYVYIGAEFNLSIVYPNKIWLLSPPDSKTTGLNTYTLFLTALNDYDLYWEEPRVTDPSTILQIWKNHYNHYAKQAEVGETNVHMNLLWHIKEMRPSVIGLTPYFGFLDWVDNRGGTFITAQELVQRVKELEAVNLRYKTNGTVISVTLDGSLSQGHPLRLFNSSDTIQSVTIDGQPWTNFRDKVVVLPSLGPGRHSIELRLGLTPTATIRGTVIDSTTGNPVGGVNVTCDGMSTLTASDGSYSFTVNLGSYTLTFKKLGYVTETRTQDCPTEGEYIVNVSLEQVPTATIRGVVTDSGTGNPIQDVSVTCDGMSTLTGSDGSYSFTVNLGSYTLIFTKASYATETRIQDCPTVGEYVVDVSMTLLTATIRGTVTDSETGAPIAGVNVTIDGAASVLTASDGSYSFTVNLGSHTLTFSKAGYVDQIKYQDCLTQGEYIVDVLLQPIPTGPSTFGKTDVGGSEESWGGNYIIGSKFQLTEAGDVSKVTAYIASWGNIMVVAAIYDDDNGRPGNLKAESNEVSVGDSFSWKDFTLSVSLEPGYYWLVLWSSDNIRYVYNNGETNQFVLHYDVGYNNWPNPFPSADYYLDVEISIYATYTVRAPGFATIRGIVTDSATGNPIQDVNVTCDGMSVLTASDGSYSFTVNLGSYTLTFEKPGYVTETRTQNCPTEGEYIVNVSMTLLTPIIRGTVTDSETGAPIAGVNVTCDGASTLTALDGSYSFAVNIGSYTLTFSKAEYVTETRTQDCPSEGEYIVDVALVPRTATITGTVTDSETGMPIDAVRVTANGYQTFTNSSGVYVLVVRLGSYTLTFSKPGYNTETTAANCPTEGTYTFNMPLRTGAKYLVDDNVGTTISLTHALGRKLFYANGRYWLFYSDGPDVVFRTSVDGESWSSKTILREEAQGWCVYVWHEFRDGTHYLHYGFSPEWYGEGVYYRRGVMNPDGTITWSTDEQLAVEGILGVVGGFWGVVPDSSGYPFIVYGWYTETRPWETLHVYVTKSDYNNGTWSTSSGFPKSVYNATDDFRISAQIVPLTSQKMYIVYCPMRLYGDTNLPLQGRLWNGSALLEPENISIGYQTSNLAFSVISQNDDVYLVYERELLSRELIFRRRHNGSWEAEEFVAPLVNYESYFTSSIDAEGTFHVFWLEDKVRHVARTPNGSWSDIDYPFGESFDFLPGDGKDNIVCIPYVNLRTIVVAWLENNGPPYTLYSGAFETKEG